MPGSLKPSRKREALSAVYTDEQLIEAFISEKNTAYFGILFERYTHLVFGLCMKYLKNPDDAEDAVMNIFEKLLSDLKQQNIRDFKSWLYMVAKNHCLMELRKKKVMLKASDYLTYEKQQEFMESLFPGHLNNEGVDKDGIVLSLQHALQELKEEQKVCIELMYLQKMSYLEVSRETGYSMKQVKSYIQNGKRNLKNLLIAK